jgi:hypothetical protein
VHGRRVIAAEADLTLELVRVAAFDSGLAVHLALTVTGAAADRARYETRPLTDPADRSAGWSYLDVWVGVDRFAVADPYFPRPDVMGCAAGHWMYRTTPQYWVDTAAPVRSLALTTEWAQIGLKPAVTTLTLTSAERAATRSPASSG